MMVAMAGLRVRLEAAKQLARTRGRRRQRKREKLPSPIARALKTRRLPRASQPRCLCGGVGGAWRGKLTGVASADDKGVVQHR